MDILLTDKSMHDPGLLEQLFNLASDRQTCWMAWPERPNRAHHRYEEGCQLQAWAWNSESKPAVLTSLGQRMKDCIILPFLSIYAIIWYYCIYLCHHLFLVTSTACPCSRIGGRNPLYSDLPCFCYGELYCIVCKIYWASFIIYNIYIYIIYKPYDVLFIVTSL